VNSCEIEISRNSQGTLSDPCARPAHFTCSDCGSGLCELHAEECESCGQIFCDSCAFYHMEQPHGKSSVPATHLPDSKRYA